MNIPESSALPGRKEKVPYVFVADAAFSLTKHIMKPYAGVHPSGSPKRIFNYRLSRARRIVESTFGIVSSVFRVLRKPMLLEPEKAEVVVMAIACVHNFLRNSQTSRQTYISPGSLDTDMNGQIMPGNSQNNQEAMTSFLPFRNAPRRSKEAAEEIRGEFTEYFNTVGAVPWQNQCA